MFIATNILRPPSIFQACTKNRVKSAICDVTEGSPKSGVWLSVHLVNTFFFPSHRFVLATGWLASFEVDLFLGSCKHRAKYTIMFCLWIGCVGVFDVKSEILNNGAVWVFCRVLLLTCLLLSLVVRDDMNNYISQYYSEASSGEYW